MCQTALVACARVHSADPVLVKAGSQVRTCYECGEDVWVAPSTLALENTWRLLFACNPCTKAEMARAVQDGRDIERYIAPGALKDDTPADRRRRNELEAHGFRDLEE
ncbi:MAG: hypothetical protein ACXVYY_01190 [Oryzihumus sp.]